MNGIETLNWDAMDWEEVAPGMQRKMVSGATMTIARLRIKKGFTVPMHAHHNEQISQVLSGRIQFWFGEDRAETHIFGPGDTLVIPANLPHEATMVEDFEGIDTWSPRREDWINGTDSYLRQPQEG